ncbi:MAG: glycosyltransferase family 4 protein [Pikeienuella sp.]
MAETAARDGHDVHVFATLNINAKNFEHLRGVTYHRLAVQLGKHLMAIKPLKLVKRLNRKLARALVTLMVPFTKYYVYRKVFAEEIAKLNPDIVHAHDLICLPAGHAAAQLSGARLVYDAHELEVHRNPPLSWIQKRTVSYVERKYSRKADSVITVGRFVGKELGRHIRRNDINIIYNSPEITECPSNIRRDIGINEETPLAIYVGKVTEGRGIRIMLDLLPNLPGMVFAAIGPSDPLARAKLEEYAMSKDLIHRFHILPPVPANQVVSYIRGADIGIISVEPVTLSYQYSMPNKLFEMSFADIPILANKLDEIEEFIAELGNGEICDFEEDRHSMPYYISRMVSQKQKYKMNESSKKLLYDKYSWDTQTIKISDIYSSLAD